jgi:iron complex outermembrane recepter protein
VSGVARRFNAAVGFMVALHCGGMAHADETAASPAELTPITVTAEKRAEPPQRIPMSVVAISADAISAANPESFRDLLLSVPGLSYSGSEIGLSRYSIRGISTAAANPTVGLYLNDVALNTVGSSFSGAIDPQLFDLDRIEILEGPQGTLYGGSAMGGAIKYVTKRPLLNVFSISAATEVAYVDHGSVSYSGESVVNLPLITDHVSVRLGASYRYDSGYVNNVADGQTQDWTRSGTSPPAPLEPLEYNSLSTFSASDFNGRSTTTSRISLSWVPVEHLTVTPVATVQRTDQANPDEFYTNLPAFESSDRLPQPTRDDLNVYSLEIVRNWHTVELTSLTGEVDRTLVLDRDFSLFIGALIPALYDNNSYNDSQTDTHTFSEELRISSASDTALRWTVGLYYSRQRNDFFQQIDTIGAASYFGTGTDIAYLGNLLNDTWQRAAFADLAYRVATWDFDLGVRRFEVNQRMDSVTLGVLNGGSDIELGRRSSAVGATPRFAVTRHWPDDDHMLYVSAAKGFRPGAPNEHGITTSLCAPGLALLDLTRIPDSYRPDSLWTYEIGSKNELDHGRGLLNVAAFHTDWRSIQQEVTIPICAFPFAGNVGAARVDGAELTISVMPVAHATLSGAVSYVNSRITESGPGVPAQVGQQLLDTPRWSGNISVQYEVPIEDQSTLQARGTYEYHGANLRQFTSVAPVTYSNGTSGEIPDATQVQQAYRVINLALQLQRGRMTYRVYVDNLTDSAPYLDFRRPAGFSAADTLRPRTIGLGARADY